MDAPRSGRSMTLRARTFSMLIALLTCLVACDKPQEEGAGKRIPVGGDEGAPETIEAHTGRSILYQLPDWSLTDHNGEAFGSEQLKGKLYAINFFFTSCPSMCPPLMDAMTALQDQLKRRGLSVPLVSLTVDPENDTPEALRLYAQSRGMDLRGWRLVTGARETIMPLITKHFRTHVGEPQVNARGMMDIAHAGFIVIVDGAGRIRAFVDTGRSPEGDPYASRSDAVPAVLRAIDTAKRFPDG